MTEFQTHPEVWPEEEIFVRPVAACPPCSRPSSFPFYLFGAAAGILWIFVFGDNPWPPFAGNILAVMIVLVCLTLWVVFMYAAYVVGKKQEAHASLNAKHVMASVGATALLVLLVVLHQWGVGNIGTKSDSVLCSEFCRGKGFSGSGMPPENAGGATCLCFDTHGPRGREGSDAGGHRGERQMRPREIPLGTSRRLCRLRIKGDRRTLFNDLISFHPGNGPFSPWSCQSAGLFVRRTQVRLRAIP